MNNMMRQIFLSFLLLNSIQCFSQKEANIWYFGTNAGLSFQSGSPKGLTNSKLSSSGGSASICTPDGKLLFYTNGYSIYDSTHTLMPNSKDERYITDVSNYQSALIVPLPDSAHIFYLFTTEGISYKGFETNLLHYSIINMRLNSGKGDVEQGKRRIPLLMFSGQRLTGTKHANGKDYWVISNKLHSFINDSSSRSDSIFAWQLTSSGLKSPVTTKTGYKDIGRGEGYLKISPDGKKIAYATYLTDSILFASFNDSTGLLSNIWIVNEDKNAFVFSVEFSQLNNYLYVSQGKKRKIYQYKAQANSKLEFIQSKKLIDSSAINGRLPLQLGSDGKIYVEEGGNGYLHVIHAPDSLGVKCRFRKNAVYLSGKTSLMGLPNFVPIFLKKYVTAITLKSSCAGDTSFFTIEDYNYPDSVNWDFGDPGSGAFNTSTKPQNISHIYSKSGTFTVKLNLYYFGRIDSLKTDIIVANPKPNFDVIDVCELDSVHFINISEPKSNLKYRWKFGDGKISVDNSPSHFYIIPEISMTYNVTLVATLTGKCSDSITKSVTVNANPKSDFSYTLNKNTVEFKATQLGNTSYKWYFGNGDSSIVKDITYTYPKIGKYKACLKVINAADCFSITCKDISISLGVSNISKSSGFKIYPNPNSGNFTLEIDNPAKDISLEVYDLLGKRVKKVEPVEKVNIINLEVNAGVYLVKVNSGGRVWFQKVVVSTDENSVR